MGEIKKVTASDRSIAKWTCPGVPWRDLLFLFQFSRTLLSPYAFSLPGK
jgi:hypothetical protein